MSDPKVILLADIDAPLPPVQLPNGRVVSVRQADGKTFQLVQQLQASNDPSLIWEIAQRCLPGATEDEVLSLTIAQATKVMTIASGAAVAVLEEVGNAQAPATEGTPPGLDSPTP